MTTTGMGDWLPSTLPDDLFRVRKVENGYSVTVIAADAPDKVYVFENLRKLSRWIVTYLKALPV